MILLPGILPRSEAHPPSSTIKLDRFEYSQSLLCIHQQIPYASAVGRINPYTGRVISNQDEYELYCHMYILSRMYERNLLSVSSQASAAKKQLTAQNESLTRANNRLRAENNGIHKRHSILIVVVLLLAVVLFGTWRSLSRTSSEYRELSSSYEAAQSELAAAQAELDSAKSTASSSSASSSSSGSSRPAGYVSDHYIGNTNSHKFHRSTCSYLPDESNQIYFDSRDEAIDAGYSPCGRCHP